MRSTDVLLVTRDEETASTVCSALESSSSIVSTNVCKDIAELRACLSQSRTAAGSAAVVVDIDHDPLRVLCDLSKVAAAHPGMRCIVLSKDFSEKLALEAMQAGARHFLRKSSIASELDKVLQRLLSHETETTRVLGDVVSVFSCSGGCGTTTVAINLANELRLASSNRVLIVDLDQCYGSVSTHLGITGRYGIGHILGRQPPIDRHLIESSAISHVEGLDVLLSPASAEADRSQPLNYENLTRALEACRESYRYVVVDAPRVPAQIAADLAAVSRFAVVVFQLTVKDVTFSRSVMSLFADSGIAAERLLPLANRVRRRGPLLKLEDGKRVIGTNSMYRIRSDWSTAMKSINRGQPLAKVARGSGLRRDFKKLAARIHRWTENGN
ncbi:MAG: AAA family ATPase [Phycisphaerales bacterium]|nr:MAG: AAA family ATPase [Phycisphaerales bacterium]